jgi:hypothetical protein
VALVILILILFVFFLIFFIIIIIIIIIFFMWPCALLQAQADFAQELAGSLDCEFGVCLTFILQ